MEVKYYLIDPTGNMTLIVETPVDESIQPECAAELMKCEPTAEQVGFLTGNTLRMAGGEFCGNASMSAAALICRNSVLTAGESRVVSLNVSGAEQKINVTVTAKADGSFCGTLEMPRASSIENKSFAFDGKVYTLPLVFYEGIVHIISENVLDKATAESAIKKWCADIGTDALGIMLYDSDNGNLEPLVYVGTANTLFWESSCASGTSALGAYLAKKNGGEIQLNINEPGGVLTVYADKNTVRLSGNIKIVKENTAKIG